MNTWTLNIPTEIGHYWFYGELSMGSMGQDYTDSRNDEPRLHLVEIFEGSNGLIGISGAQFVYLNEFKPSNRAEGVVGYWLLADLPVVPDDSENVFVYKETP